MRRIFPFLLVFAPLVAVELQPGVDFTLSQDENIVVHNRVLLKINGKPLSVMDVVRKMDLIFYQQYPTLAGNARARYQFYQQNWQTMLSAMLDDQLILADAKDKRISATDGEVREALEKLFGNDPIMKLHELGMSYEEAAEMMRTDLIVQKLTGGMVHAKALTAVNPKKMRRLYEKLLRENPPQERYLYRVLSFRGAPEESHALAQQAHTLLKEGGSSFENIPAVLKSEEVRVALSEPYSRKVDEISTAHRGVLATLAAGDFSAPITRKGSVYLFHLEDLEKESFPSFNEMESELKARVLEEEIVEYNKKYRTDLRKRYGLTEKHLSQLLPSDFHPFALR